MAASMLPIGPVNVRASLNTSHRKPETSVGQKAGSSSKWWSPIFGWSTEADYIDSDKNKKIITEDNVNNGSESDHGQGIAVRSRISRGSLTEEKARQLRMMTNETTTFHDVMYHSAIASRLASDFSNRSSDR